MASLFRVIFKLLSVIIALGIVVLVLVLAASVYFDAPPEKPPAPSEGAMKLEKDGALLLEVRSGETAYSVGKRLENAGVIRSRYFWNLLSRLGREYIKTGTYRIELPANQIKIRSMLVSGEQLLKKVTVPEGVTLKKTARLLEDEGVCSAEEFLSAASSRDTLDAYHIPGATMEGYLFPDTYLFPLGYPAQKVVSTMADTFFNRLKEIAPESLSMSADERNKRVIVASIVEREYLIPEEAPLMAGVFYNRLKIGMGLQSCATVEYVITEIQGRPHPEMLYNKDLEIRDPYNTYLRPGLPPGPISAPGETALKAAFNPAPSTYLYFRLIDPSTGQHYFSSTLDEHIRAGALYLKRR